VQVRLGDLDVVAEDLVVAHLERADARAPPLARFHLGDVARAMGAELAQLIELAVVAFADDAGFGGARGCGLADGATDLVAQLGQLIHRGGQLFQARRREGLKLAAQTG
jgi:hypothetical protein